MWNVLSIYVYFLIHISIDVPNQGYSNYNTNNKYDDSELHVSIDGC